MCTNVNDRIVFFARIFSANSIGNSSESWKLAVKVIARPSGTASDTPTTFTNLPANTLDVGVAAYSTADGTKTLEVSATTTKNATISLSSTVAKLFASPTPITLTKGATAQVNLYAKDTSGDIVLLSVGPLRNQ